MASVDGKSFVVARLSQLRMTVFPMDVGHMPNCMRQSRSIARCAVDCDRFLVAPQGRVAVAHVSLDLTETGQRPGQLGRCAGFAIKIHCLDQIRSCVGEPILSSRVKGQLQQFVGAVGHIACQVSTGNSYAATDDLLVVLAHRVPMLVGTRN